MPAKSESPESGAESSEPGSEVAGPDSRPQDDLKRRFREALDRKNARAKAGESHANRGSKVHREYGPASNRRNFRRKSG